MEEKPAIKFEVVQNENPDWYFEQRETLKRHTPYEWEMIFFESIREGNVERMEQLAKISNYLVGKMSSNDLRQAQYLAVAFITLATRSAIQGGMFEMDAYNQSDAFIQKIDRQVSADKVIQLTVDTLRALAADMRALKIRKTYSIPVRVCMEYIYQHLHQKVDLKTIARVCNVSAPYLSALFKKEVGMGVSNYILEEKINAAKSMMVHSAMSVQEISNYLEFSSQSYFIHCFKKVCGITPGEYLRKNG